jgi:hypothetical protein
MSAAVQQWELKQVGDILIACTNCVKEFGVKSAVNSIFMVKLTKYIFIH